MTDLPANATGYDSGASPKLWVMAALLGAVTTVVGLLLLFNIKASVATIVLFVGLSLLVTAVAEVALAEKRTAWVWIEGLALAVGGVIVFSWPEMTLWALAVVAGISLIANGIARALWSMVGQNVVGNRFLGVILGIATFVLGVLALTWPEATVFVIAVVFGLRTLVFGVTMLVEAYMLHSVENTRLAH